MSKLIVAGCSVSDYTNVKKVWGEYLAEQLNLNWAIQFTLVLSIGSIIALLSGMISIKGIINILKAEK